MKKQEHRNRIGKYNIYMLLAENKRLLCYAFLWAVPLAFSTILGWRLKLRGTVFGGAQSAGLAVDVLLFLLESICLSVLAAVFAVFILRKAAGECSERKRKHEQKEMKGKTEIERPLWQTWFFYAAVIFLCWLPVFLAYYPSVFAYDAEGQLYQVIAGDYSTHHPLLHTLFLGAFFRLGGVIGSYSAGMAVHSVVQMLLMAAAFGWGLSFLYQRRVPKWIRVLVLLFYALFPANSVLALSTTKDVLFSALVMIDTLCLYRLLCEGKEETGRREQVVYVIFTVLMLLFRNNAVYAFLVTVPVVGIVLWRIKNDQNGQYNEPMWDGKTAGKKYIRLSLTAFLIFAVCAVSLKAFTHAHSGSPREMLSVPLQQMARTRVEAEEKLEPSMRQELEQYIPAEWVFAAYCPHLADPVKNRAVIHDDPKGLITTWIKLGLQYPAIYIDAFLDNSMGLWFLQDTSHAEIYGIGTESGFGYLSTDNRPMPAGCEVVENSVLPGLRVFMEKIVSDNVYQKLPVIRLLFAPALYWWLLYLYLVAVLYKKKYLQILPVVFLLVYYLTLLLSPAVLVRYMYPFMATIPVILPCLFCGNNDREVKIHNKLLKI